MPTHAAQPDTMKSFLRSIGRIPLLTAEQEIELSRSIQAGLAAETDPPSLERDRIVKAGQIAKRKMIEANLRLVVAIAKKYQNRGLELLDLIQEGTLGLNRAAEKYDSGKGFKFSTYAYWWIRQGITRALSEQGRTIRLPVHIIEKLNKLKRTRRKLTEQLGRTPSRAELATELGIDEAKLSELLAGTREIYSLDHEVRTGDIDSDSLGSFIAGTNGWDVFEEIATDDLISQFFGCLSKREKQVIWLRYGFEDGRPQPLGSVGKEIGISRELVRRIQRQALNKLRSQRSLFEFCPSHNVMTGAS